MKKLLSILVILALSLSILSTVGAAKAAPEMLPEEVEVLKIVNREREKTGANPLTALPILQKAADIRAEEIVIEPSHNRPNGTSWRTVFQELGIISYQMRGENIAFGYPTPASVMVGWMNSQGHRENILNAGYYHMGAGYHYDGTSTYGHHWVQLFYKDFDCAYTAMTLNVPEGSTKIGTAPEDLGIIATMNCACCGKSYLPVLESYITGYDPNQDSPQTITVRALGLSATMTIDLSAEQEETTVPPTEESPFVDVNPTEYFAKPIQWAVEQGITNGTGAGKFSPDRACTRGQIVTFLWRAAGSPKPAATKNPFGDVTKDAYYYDAVLWAVENEITTGTSQGKFSPDKTCTRGQVATFLWRSQQKPRANNSENPFTDIQESDYYYEAVLWAAEKGITTGVGQGLFAPNRDCTRGQIVTFLYRAMS